MKQKEFFDLAAEMEEKCGDWENSKGLSDEARASLMAKIDALIRKVRRRQRKKRRFSV